jgi:pilus assembly protein CpaE
VSGPSTNVRLLLVEDVAQVSQYIRNMLNAQPHVQLLDVLTDGRTALEQVRAHRPDILMIDALLQGRLSGLQLLEQLRHAGYDLPVIVITVPQRPVKVDPAWGTVRVLSMPFSGFDLINAIQAAQHEAAANRPEATSRTLVVHGAKGGVGKTTLAFNLAVAIAHAKGMRTIVVDGNLQFGDIRVSETDLEQVVWRDPSGIDILLAPPRMEMAEMVTVRDMDKTVSLLKRVYNVVIIDTPTLVNDHVLSWFDASDVIIELTTGDWTTMHNTRLMAHTFSALGFSAERVCYVLNRAGAPGTIDPRLIAEQLGRRPDFTLPSDGRLVVEANNQGIPFVLADPRAQVSVDVGRMAGAFVTPHAPLAGAAAR